MTQAPDPRLDQHRDQDPDQDPDQGGAPDLEYDEAHGVPSSTPAPQQHRPVYVTTETDDHGGDYSYDLAHDVPRRPSAR